MAGFELDPAFLGGSAPVCSLALCEVRLQDDARWPWLILVPGRAGVFEVDDLPPADRAQLYEELSAAGRAVRAVGAALGPAVEVLNTAKIGNVTPQLHWHVVGRRRSDPLWPAPPWGQPGVERYAPETLARAVAEARAALHPA